MGVTVNDIENRWKGHSELRSASIYAGSVVLAAAAMFTAFVMTGSLIWASSVPVVLFIGGLAALLKTYRAWRVDRVWPIWHGAAWFLLILTLASLCIPAVALQS